jgi:hypothetical protein
MQALFRFSTPWVCLALLSLIVTGCGGGAGIVAPQWKAGDVPVGQWGDSSVGNLQVTQTGGELDSGCLVAKMTSAPILDAGKRFAVAGTYHTNNLPPIPLFTYPAQFNGVVDGASMSLTITVNDGVNAPFTVGPIQFSYGRRNAGYTGTCP